GYDRSNDAMTLGMHRRWRRRVCRLAVERMPKNARWLDIATGTADVLIGVLRERPDLRAIGLDPAGPMLRLAREKLDRPENGVTAKVDLGQGDCRRLPFPDNTFDAVTI